MKESIIQSCADGRLLTWLARAVRDTGVSERDAVFGLVVTLHKGGQIDALGALLDTNIDWDWTPEWPDRQHILATLIPRLDVSGARKMAALGAIKATRIQHVLDEAFLAWCAADLGRADQIIASLNEGVDVPNRFVLAALVAGLRSGNECHLEISASMATGERRGSRQVGARALGLMPFTDNASVSVSVAALRSVIDAKGLEATIRADALSAALEIAVRTPSAPVEQFLELLRLAPGDADPLLLDACAEAFGRHAPRLSDALFGGMREVLPKLEAERTQAFDRIDMGLYHLLSTPGHEDRALTLIEDLVTRKDGRSVFQHLDSVRHELSNGDAFRLSRVVVRWLMSGDAPLCDAAASLVQGVHGRVVILNADFRERALTDAEASFLARKAIGWFLLQAVSATSLVVSLLQQVTDEETEPLADLLLDPLLMNYPGSVRRYLDRIVPILSNGAREALDRTLARHDAYCRAIEAVGSLPELHQTERNRRIEFQRQNDAFSAARREAEKQSVFFSIVRKSVLLHGARSVSYVGEPGGGTRRLDNKLGRIGTEIELPMQWTFDPLGLEHTLLAFRLEPPPA
jgi:hypothetical protein